MPTLFNLHIPVCTAGCLLQTLKPQTQAAVGHRKWYFFRLLKAPPVSQGILYKPQ